MNKNRFMKLLELKLMDRGISLKERMEILITYEEHFTAGIEEGRSEEEISLKLGKPDEIAGEYGTDQNEDSGFQKKGIIRRLCEIVKSIRENGIKNYLGIIPLSFILILICLIWILTIGIIFSGSFSLYAGISALINGKVVLFPKLKIGGNYEWFIVYFSISIISGGALAFIGMYYVVRAFLGLMIKQIK